MDVAMTASLQYSNKGTASVTASAIAEFPKDLVITGTKGHIKVLFTYFF